MRAGDEKPMGLQIYDDFDRPGYSLTDYEEKWLTPFGLGEMAVKDTRDFSGGCLTLTAVPFQTTADVSVNDHLKYMAVSSRTFPVPKSGTLLLSADVKASTQGTVPDLVQQGVFGPSGSWLDPSNPPTPPAYCARLLPGQQASVVLNVFDFCTGLVFDWFIGSDKAFSLYERLPSTVTGNVTNPVCPNATEVGIEKMYTQIIEEMPVKSGVWHHAAIALTRVDGEVSVDYFLDGLPVSHVPYVGIPLDRQGTAFTGTYPSLGPGERVAAQLDSVRFGHGLFSLLDAFPFQHAGAAKQSVSIPAQTPPASNAAGRSRLFGQGASGSFDNFTTLTLPGSGGSADPTELAHVIAAARARAARASPAASTPI